jgi:predicted O-methyltransferase YrrM
VSGHNQVEQNNGGAPEETPMKNGFDGLDITIKKYLDLDSETRERIGRRSSPLDDLAYLAILLRANEVEDMIEVGTFLGQSAVFLAPAIKGTFHTVNYNPREVVIAKEVVAKYGIKNVEFHTGDSLKVLPGLVELVSPRLGAVYLDGNHSYKYAIGEFRIVEPYLRDKSSAVVFFDDAHYVHPDGATDGGVPKAAEEAGARPIGFIGNRIALKTYGTFKAI